MEGNLPVPCRGKFSPHDDENFLYGTQWELEIDFKESYQYHDGRRTIKVQGNNAYPPLWTKMLRKITPFLGIKPSEF